MVSSSLLLVAIASYIVWRTYSMLKPGKDVHSKLDILLSNET